MNQYIKLMNDIKLIAFRTLAALSCESVIYFQQINESLLKVFIDNSIEAFFIATREEYLKYKLWTRQFMLPDTASTFFVSLSDKRIKSD